MNYLTTVEKVLALVELFSLQEYLSTKLSHLFRSVLDLIGSFLFEKASKALYCLNFEENSARNSLWIVY